VNAAPRRTAAPIEAICALRGSDGDGGCTAVGCAVWVPYDGSGAGDAAAAGAGDAVAPAPTSRGRPGIELIGAAAIGGGAAERIVPGEAAGAAGIGLAG
jgi:hypothetical protein